MAQAQFMGNRYDVWPEYADTVWIVTGKKGLGSPFRKVKIDFSFDARQTLVSNTTARMGGIRLGIEYRRVHRIGFGIYGLDNGVSLKSLQEIDPKITSAVLNLSYFSMYYERVLFFNRKWEWSATLHSGRGVITGSYRTGEDSAWQDFPTRVVRPLEVSTTGYYHITWWCSAGAGIGYRFIRSAPSEILPLYNAPVGILKVRIKLGKLVKSIWNDKTRYEY